MRKMKNNSINSNRNKTKQPHNTAVYIIGKNTHYKDTRQI